MRLIAIIQIISERYASLIALVLAAHIVVIYFSLYHHPAYINIYAFLRLHRYRLVRLF